MLEADFGKPLNNIVLPTRATSKVPQANVLRSVLVSLPLTCVTYLAKHWEAVIVKPEKGSDEGFTANMDFAFGTSSMQASPQDCPMLTLPPPGSAPTQA